MSDAFEFYIDIEDNAGALLGPGPITSAEKWTYMARMDGAGRASFAMPASDPKAALIVRKRKARAWALVGGVWTEVGALIIDRIDRKPRADGIVWLTVAGDDEVRELAGRSVGDLDLSGGGLGESHLIAVGLIASTISSPWAVIPSGSPGNDYVYARFAGESALSAFRSVADKTLTHFYRSGPRQLTFASDFTPSGIRAIQADADDLAPETCAIVSLTESIETYDLLTRIVPLGAGNGEARLTLAASSRTAPTGFTVNKPANYLQHNASVTEFGVIDAPWIEFKDIRPVSNTDADMQAAADMLFDQALKELIRRAILTQSAFYAVELAGCSQLLKPLQTLRLVYQDLDAGMDIDTDVNILSATWEVTTDGIQTTAVELSTYDTWPETDIGAIVERITEGTVYQAHPQLNANAYVIAYTKHLDEVQANPAEFRFRFDQEVTQLTRVCFDFQLLPLESTVTAVGLEQTTGGVISTTFTGSSGGESTPNTGASSASNTTSQSTSDSGAPSGGDTGTGGQHQHVVTIQEVGSAGGLFPLYASGSPAYIAALGAGIDIDIFSSSSGNHSHDIGHNHPIAHSHGIAHTHVITHTHTFTPAVTMVYGLFRDSVANVFALDDLEYSLDGTTWYYFITGVNGYVSLGGGWHRVDITELVQNPTTFRPLASNNLLQIRRKTLGATGKRTTIDAQLSVRSIIQSIAFS